MTHGAQRTQVKDAVRHCPRESGYNMSLWTTKLVRHFIATRFGVEHCRERVRQLLHALGFRLRRLRHRRLKAKPEEQEAFRAELEALLEDWSEAWELIKGRLVLKAQPADAPELNPQERIWKWLRRVVTHHHWVATLGEQIDAIRNSFRDLAGVKE